MYWIGFIAGSLCGMLIAFVYNRLHFIKEKRKVKKYIKRGLYTSSFTRTYGGKLSSDSRKETYEAVVEIGLLERTKTKMKIEIIGEIRTSISSDDNDIKQLKQLIEGWRDNDDEDIEWFEEHPADVRVGKIDDILK